LCVRDGQPTCVGRNDFLRKVLSAFAAEIQDAGSRQPSRSWEKTVRIAGSTDRTHRSQNILNMHLHRAFHMPIIGNQLGRISSVGCRIKDLLASLNILFLVSNWI
jgi:hypothetical protein